MIRIDISDPLVVKLLVKLKINPTDKNPTERRKALADNLENLSDQDKLRFLRNNNNMTQEEFGKQVLGGVNGSAVCHYEDGSRPLPKLAINYIKEYFPQKEEI